MSRGHTLLEIATVLALLAAAFAAVSPALKRYRDDAAAMAARESVAGLIAKARVAAIGRGGAEVHVATAPSTVMVIVGTDTTWIARVEEDTGAIVDLNGRPALVLAFDEVGLGRLASATIRFRRGQAERALIVSSFGRVRRQ